MSQHNLFSFLMQSIIVIIIHLLLVVLPYIHHTRFVTQFLLLLIASPYWTKNPTPKTSDIKNEFQIIHKVTVNYKRITPVAAYNTIRHPVTEQDNLSIYLYWTKLNKWMPGHPVEHHCPITMADQNIYHSNSYRTFYTSEHLWRIKKEPIAQVILWALCHKSPCFKTC